MNVPSRISALILPLLLLTAASCALSPQVIPIQPDLQPPAAGPGNTRGTLALKVEDARSDKVIGYRGGVYATASLTASPDMTDAVYRELAANLTARGYSIQSGGTADISLLVEITGLGYVVTEKNLVHTVATSAVVRATSSAGGKTRSGEYRDRRTKEMVKLPSEAENRALINDILSSVLQQLVSDPDLLKF